MISRVDLMGHCIESVPLFSYAIVLAKNHSALEESVASLKNCSKGIGDFPNKLPRWMLRPCLRTSEMPGDCSKSEAFMIFSGLIWKNRLNAFLKQINNVFDKKMQKWNLYV